MQGTWPGISRRRPHSRASLSHCPRLLPHFRVLNVRGGESKGSATSALPATGTRLQPLTAMRAIPGADARIARCKPRRHGLWARPVGRALPDDIHVPANRQSRHVDARRHGVAAIAQSRPRRCSRGLASWQEGGLVGRARLGNASHTALSDIRRSLGIAAPVKYREAERKRFSVG